MGYSMSVSCRSQKARDHMLWFLEEFLRPWRAVAPHERAGSGGPFPTKDLDYPVSNNKCQIGFNYSGLPLGYPEYEYYWSVLRWVALQVGRRRRVIRSAENNKRYYFPEPVPYTVYDGYDNWPVLTDRPEPRLRWCWVDRFGVRKDKNTIANHYSNSAYDMLVTSVTDQDGVRRSTLDERAVKILGREPARMDLGCAVGPTLGQEDRVLLVKKLLWPQILEMRKPVLKEMRRLDSTWRWALKVNLKKLILVQVFDSTDTIGTFGSTFNPPEPLP